MLIVSGLILSYLNHQANQLKTRGKASKSKPHPFSTAAWHDDEEAHYCQAKLEIANLEAQVSMLEEAGSNLDKVIELMEIKNKRLEQALVEERRKFEPVDPEIFRRIYGEMHRPIQQPQSPQSLTKPSLQ